MGDSGDTMRVKVVKTNSQSVVDVSLRYQLSVKAASKQIGV